MSFKSPIEDGEFCTIIFMLESLYLTYKSKSYMQLINLVRPERVKSWPSLTLSSSARLVPDELALFVNITLVSDLAQIVNHTLQEISEHGLEGP